MDKLHLILEAVGTLGILCGLLSRVLPEGKAQAVCAKLGFLLAAGAKAALPAKGDK